MGTDQQEEKPPGRLVVVGASAGGIEALSTLVSTLPRDFPAPVVLAQHLDPNRQSHLASILERRTKLPVVAVSGTTIMRPGHIYVVPANRHVLVADGQVRLEDDHGGRPRPSIDLLLTSAASVYGDRLVAVVLTGSGSDGAAGAVDVKDAGGTVIIQNPRTAAYPSMPLALPPTAVDHIAELEAIGPLLGDVLAGLEQPLPPDDSGLQDILAEIGRRSNIDFRPYKPSTILRRIGRRMVVTHNATLKDYSAYLEKNPAEVAELVMALLIKVTEFFRDPDAFLVLRNSVLPQIIESGAARGRVLRLWSAGCATGEEAYSLALLVADLLGPDLPHWSVKVFATDLDEFAINFARRGHYPRNVLRNLPEEYLNRYFEPAENGLRIAKTLRQMVIFGQQDISRGVPFPRIDLVVCRNLLIYFKPELQQDVLDLFAYSLHQTKGYLFLGKAETARPTKASFELANKRWKLYRCLSGPATGVPRLRVPTEAAALATHGVLSVESQADTPVNEGELAGLRRYNETLLRFVSVGIVVIDPSYRMLSVNNTARRLLGIREVGSEQDFLHTARGLPYSDVRRAIDNCFRDRTGFTLPEIALQGQVGETRHLTLTFTPLPVETPPGSALVVTILDTTESAGLRRQLSHVLNEQKALLEELTATNQRLGDANKELQDANEELQAANEELMLTQEELQATNEEFEATNEELQATNEELETNNEELQATNEELETTNEELSARGSEVQELSRLEKVHREQLVLALQHAPAGILLARAPELAIEVANDNAAALLGARAGGDHTLEEVCREAELPDLLAAARTVLHREQPSAAGTLRVEGMRATRSVSFRVVPLLDGRDGVGRLAIYLEETAAP